MPHTETDSTIHRTNSAEASNLAMPAESIAPVEHKSLKVVVEHKRFDPEPLSPIASTDSALTAILIGTLLLVFFNADSISRAIRNYSHKLWSIRRRPNVFDDESIISLRVSAMLELVFVVFGGIVISSLHVGPQPLVFVKVLMSMCIMVAYFLFQYAVYTVIGYTFADNDGCRQFIQGFLASQSFAALLLIVPALLLVYAPVWRRYFVIASLLIYCVCHLLFIGKGFRIFYRNYKSLFYFILYLCAVEIIPVLALYRVSEYLWASNVC